MSIFITTSSAIRERLYGIFVKHFDLLYVHFNFSFNKELFKKLNLRYFRWVHEASDNVYHSKREGAFYITITISLLEYFIELSCVYDEEFQFLSDTETYVPTPHMTLNTIEKKIDCSWKGIATRNTFPANITKSNITSSSETPTFYHLIKQRVHVYF